MRARRRPLRAEHLCWRQLSQLSLGERWRRQVRRMGPGAEVRRKAQAFEGAEGDGRGGSKGQDRGKGGIKSVTRVKKPWGQLA